MFINPEPLPLEIWALVASYCQKKSDVCSLAQVSRTLVSAARMVLYRDVVLDALRIPDLDIHPTMQMLNSWPSVTMGRAIHSLTLHHLQDITFYDVPFENIPNLSSLSIIRCPVFILTSDAQKEFIHKIKTVCGHLRRFHLDADDLNPDDDFGIPNLTHITWIEQESISPSFISLCRASRTSLASLSVYFTEVDVHNLEDFCGYEFPRLRSLEIGPGDLAQVNVEQTSLAVTKLLVAHPRLVYLRLRYLWSLSGPDVYLLIHNLLFSEFTLPLLRHLDAHPLMMTKFLWRRSGFIRNCLDTLSISEGLHHQGHPYLILLFKMFVKFKEEIGFDSHIRHLLRMLLRVHNGYMYSNLLSFRSLMIAAAEAFPELEIWEGDVPDEDLNAVIIVADVFARFHKLREICMYIEHMPRMFKDVPYLAQRCPLLETIRVGDSSNTVHWTCHITRDITDEKRITTRWIADIEPKKLM